MTDGVWSRLGDSPAVGWIAEQIARGDVAHAWLLLGPAGSGKRGAATALAAALNCTSAPGLGCGRCSTCLRIMRHRFPDVHHIAPEGPLIPVGVVREQILPEAARSPFEGDWKVFVLEESDRMNEEAQNALLKTLEEPHPGTVFVLLSDHEEDLLETILSRCRIVRLEPVSEERIVELLVEEGAGQSDALLSARVSDGDYDRARAVALDAAVRDRRRVWIGLPRRLAAAVDALDAATEVTAEAKEAVKARERAQKEEVEALAEALGEGRGTATARNALARRHKRELRRLEEEVLGDALQTLASFFRDVLVLRSGGHDAVVNLDVTDELESWAAAEEISSAALVDIVSRCIEARAALTHNANALLQLEAVLLDIVRLAPAPARVGSGW
jgi:DNA polymerase III subunit delta'